MKCKLLLALFMIAGTFSACKNNYANSGDDKVSVLQDSANFTQILWLDSVKNFEPIIEGQKLELSFRFRNTGTKPLVIERVQPTCGCTLADPPKEPIAPGQEGVIKGTFDSNNKLGPNHKTMYVYANTTPKTEHPLIFNVIVNKKEK